jgi:tRNA pseudouridine55 synthase
MPKVSFEIKCSKGTYIRSIAHDFGTALNSGSHLSKLCRTAIGDYQLVNSIDLSDFEKQLNS